MSNAPVIRGRRAVPDPVYAPSHKPCVRCGIVRRTSERKNTTGLCRDCVACLSPEEVLRVWAR